MSKGKEPQPGDVEQSATHGLGVSRKIGLELLAHDERALRRRILEAQDSRASTRAEILRAAERRCARTANRGVVTSQLFAMPVVVDFGDTSTSARRESKLLGHDQVWQSTIERIWRCAFDSRALEVRLVPTIVHLNAVLGISPCTVHEQAFRGASVFEGRQPGTVSMCNEGQGYELGGGPRAIVYLLLGYIASPASADPVAAGTLPRDRSIEQYLGAWFAVKTGKPSVRTMPPRRFYDALEDAHTAQLLHFVRWCKSRGYPHRLDCSSAGSQSDHVVISGHFQRRVDTPWEEVSWSYDGSWRGAFDLARVRRVDALDGASSTPLARNLDVPCGLQGNFSIH